MRVLQVEIKNLNYYFSCSHRDDLGAFSADAVMRSRVLLVVLGRKCCEGADFQEVLLPSMNLAKVEC